jgi:hypothetical protein
MYIEWLNSNNYTEKFINYTYFSYSSLLKHMIILFLVIIIMLEQYNFNFRINEVLFIN